MLGVKNTSWARKPCDLLHARKHFLDPVQLFYNTGAIVDLHYLFQDQYLLGTMQDHQEPEQERNNTNHF